MLTKDDMNILQISIFYNEALCLPKYRKLCMGSKNLGTFDVLDLSVGLSSVLFPGCSANVVFTEVCSEDIP